MHYYYYFEYTKNLDWVRIIKLTCFDLSSIYLLSFRKLSCFIGCCEPSKYIYENRKWLTYIQGMRQLLLLYNQWFKLSHCLIQQIAGHRTRFENLGNCNLFDLIFKINYFTIFYPIFYHFELLVSFWQCI